MLLKTPFTQLHFQVVHSQHVDISWRRSSRTSTAHGRFVSFPDWADYSATYVCSTVNECNRAKYELFDIMQL
jgi:hypothetical protein